MNTEIMQEDIPLNTETNEDDHVSPELEIARKVAKSAGWAPKEEWRHDPEKWEDADKYLERIPEQIQSLKQRVKQTGQAAQRALEEIHSKARADALEEVRKAAAVGNQQAAYEAAQRAAQVSSPVNPEVEQWVSEHPWFNTDPVARQRVLAIDQLHAQLGKTVTERLKAVDQEMSQLAPQYYHQHRQSEAQAPSVQPGNRQPRTPVIRTGWDSLPTDVKAQLTPIAKQMATSFPKIDLKQHKERIAASYYKEQGDE